MQIRGLILLLVLPLLAGCNTFNMFGVGTVPLQIEPAHKGAAISPRFGQSYYYVDRDQNLYFVMKSATTEAGKPVEQIMTIRVFWQPRGGVTTMNPSALNSTFRYVLITPDAMGIY